MSAQEKRSLLDWTIRPALRSLPGVADVNVLGGHVRTFEVIPAASAMAARGDTTQMLEKAVGSTTAMTVPAASAAAKKRCWSGRKVVSRPWTISATPWWRRATA